jgi:hypothetical protein
MAVPVIEDVTVNVSGHSCIYREQVYTENFERVRGRICEASLREFGARNYYGLICPVCNEKLQANQRVYLVFNNSKLFPNCVIHTDCAIGGIEDIMGNLIEITERLAKRYKEFMDAVYRDRAWLYTILGDERI